MARKNKIPVEVVIPDEFRDFMKHVAQLIAAGDVSATVPSDDALQCDRAYGGLYDVERRLYGFRLFPGLGDAYWDFSLHDSQIRAIAVGELNVVRLWRCANSKCQHRHAWEESYCPKCDNVLDYVNVEGELHLFQPDAADDVITCMANLRRVAFAVLNYNRDTGHFPPPYTTDDEGRLLHSWRTLILPQLDEQPLFDRVVTDEPWDSPRNRQLWDAMPHVYRCAMLQGETSTTSFVAVTGNETIWPTGATREIGDVKAGTSYVILLIEQSACRTIWMNPLDRRFADMFNGQSRESLSSGHVAGEFIAAFVDGHVDPITTDIEPERLRRLLTIR